MYILLFSYHQLYHQGNFGLFAFEFTLVNGVATVAEMLLFSFFGLFIFIGIGSIISGLVQNENSIAPIANTIVLPQILLCGLFFPIDNYPHLMQRTCNALPLSFFVDRLRKIAFEEALIWATAFKSLRIAGLDADYRAAGDQIFQARMSIDF